MLRVFRARKVVEDGVYEEEKFVFGRKLVQVFGGGARASFDLLFVDLEVEKRITVPGDEHIRANGAKDASTSHVSGASRLFRSKHKQNRN